MSDLDRLITPEWIKKHPKAAGRLRSPVRKAGWMSYAEFITWAAANGKPARPIGRFEKDLPANLPVPTPKPRPDEMFPDPTMTPARELNAEEMASLARCLTTKPEE
jgi:hypothetical protein